jgi:SAM-dependent methyltransferase
MAELLELDAEVLHAHLSDVTAWLQGQAADLLPRHILDLGSGTGAGTLALLQRFGDASVIAVDMSAYLLDRLRGNASARGVAGRVRTVQADLDTGWPAIGPVDLVWASSSLHHLADPDRVLTEVSGALRPGGLLAVLEMDSFPRFLPDDPGAGQPGIEARCQAALAEQRAAELPHLGSDWGPRLSGAGFTIEARQTFAVHLTSLLPPATGRYAQASLRRIREGLGGRLSNADLATLDTLIDSDGPAGVRQRTDLTVRTTRTGWLARRP